MRKPVIVTSCLLLWFPAGGRTFSPRAACAADAAEPSVSQPATTSRSSTRPATSPTTRPDEHARLAQIDAAMQEQRWALALEETRAALREIGSTPAMHLRAAQAYFHLGQVLGTTEVREVRNGQAGQFDGSWLLFEPRGPRSFLCCPEASALYQIRRALDAGLDTPAAHLLHARIWLALGKPRVGFELLKGREAVLRDQDAAAALDGLSELALAADELDDYLRYAQLRAAREPRRHDAILGETYVNVAQRYAQRGDATLYAAFLHRALSLRPDDVGLLTQVAEAEWSSGHHAEAAALYRRILQLDPHHPQRNRMLERAAVAAPASQPAP